MSDRSTGRWGGKTRLGIEAFRKTAGLPGGADIDAALIEALRTRFPADVNSKNDSACTDVQVTQSTPNQLCIGGTLVEGKCTCFGETQPRQVRDNVFACVGISPPAPDITCERGIVHDGKCGCPRGTEQKQTGENAFDCVETSTLAPTETTCEGGQMKEGKCACPEGTEPKQTGDNAFACVGR